MIYTGERPTFENRESIISSVMRYKSVFPFCKNKKIIDLGCGIGHGTKLLMLNNDDKEKIVVGVDINLDSITEATKGNKEFISNLSFVCRDIFNVNFKGFVIVSMIEFIEHIEKSEAEKLIKKISNNVQTLVLTTPNGDFFKYHPKDDSEYKGFHKWHYAYEELLYLCNKEFKFVEVYAHLFDPKIRQFTSYIVFATNMIYEGDSTFSNTQKVY
ncbi:MAG: class I SAM-dependent methyltransferase [Candidatus Nanoarchaeia archaeon]|jgi:2-polyprenyl-3-methyl-5-hydroxy-6-metoxy-1,4-benzoquinol methylase|nr:class I SAM-dependent methyltransferase [Candidatus Nanoarchaeia archaeon]